MGLDIGETARRSTWPTVPASASGETRWREGSQVAAPRSRSMRLRVLAATGRQPSMCRVLTSGPADGMTT